MRRVIFWVTFALEALFFLTACAGTSDWTIPLINEYEVWHINSKNVKIVYKTNSEDADEIPSFVKEYAYDNRFIFTCNVDSIDENNLFEEKFYILDTVDKKRYGPYYSNAFHEVIEKIGVEIPMHWYRT